MQNSENLPKEVFLAAINICYNAMTDEGEYKKQGFVFSRKGQVIERTPFFINGLKQVNILIGENNAGKSRFMRGILQTIKNENDKREIYRKYQPITNNDLKLDVQDIGQNIVDAADGKSLSGLHFLIKKLYDKYNLELADFLLDTYSIYANRNRSFPLYNYAAPYLSSLSLYIPILRGTRPAVGSPTKDHYIERTINDYFKKTPSKENFRAVNSSHIFTGQTMFEMLKDHLMGNKAKRKMVSDLEDFLSIHFFNSTTVTLTPITGSDVVHIQIGDDDDRPIYDLGDGIQALLVLLFPLFLNSDKEMIIFIEEPELHLHPKWQRLFVDTIIEKFPHFQFFFTTHSNVFMNIEGASIYRFEKQGNETEIEYVEITEDKRSVLLTLGYQAADMLQSNFIIWVEGVSDIPYIQHFLSCTDESLVLGRDYSIMLYGGSGFSALKKLDETGNIVISLNPNFAIIMDSDRESEGKYEKEQEHKQIKDMYENHTALLWITDCREIENYIPEELFKQAILQKTKKDGGNYEVIFLEECTKYGDRGKYQIKEKDSIKIISPTKPNRKIKLPKHLLNDFDVKTGLQELLKTNDIAQYRSFIGEISKAMLDATSNQSYDKREIAQAVVEIMKKDTNRIWWDEFDDEIKSQMQKLANKIKAVKG